MCVGDGERVCAGEEEGELVIAVAVAAVVAVVVVIAAVVAVAVDFAVVFIVVASFGRGGEGNNDCAGDSDNDGDDF